MWESLIDTGEAFLRAARKLYGEGHPIAGLSSLGQVISSDLPSIPGVGAALDAADVLRDDLAGELEELCEKDSLIGDLITRACDSVVSGGKRIEDDSEMFRKSVTALGPLLDSPFGILAILPIFASVVAGVTGQIAGTNGQMADLSKEAPGVDPRERARRYVPQQRVFRASSFQRAGYQPSNPLSALESQRFMERLANYTGSVPGLAPGIDRALSLAMALDGTPYRMGGFSLENLDCTAAMSVLGNYALGLEPFASRMSTVDAPQWLAAHGAVPGLGEPGDFNISFYERGGGGANGHMAGTIAGVNVEAGGSSGMFRVGGDVGAGHPMFDQHWHFRAEDLPGGAAIAGGGASIAV